LSLLLTSLNQSLLLQNLTLGKLISQRVRTIDGVLNLFDTLLLGRLCRLNLISLTLTSGTKHFLIGCGRTSKASHLTHGSRLGRRDLSRHLFDGLRLWLLLSKLIK